MSEKEEDFKVSIGSKDSESDTIIITSHDFSQKWLEEAMYRFDNNYTQYSAYLNESSLGKSTLTNEEIDVLSDNPQNHLQKVMKINQYARFFINKDDLIGKIYETIESNINTDVKISYKDYTEKRNKAKLLDKAKIIIENFNEQINIRQLLRKSVPLAYSEGNYPMYLRTNSKGNYIVDYYPLGVSEVSDYEIDGEPVLLINVSELTSRLQKTYKKTKKGKSLFFDSVENELSANYPPEVLEAFKNKETYAKLIIENSGILRVNNLNRKYGVTPIFRTFKSAIMLDTFEKSDRVNAKAKAKKIIFQKLRKELLGEKGDEKAFEEMAYAHDAFMAAWKNETVIYTGPAFVEDIKYIEPTVESMNINTLNMYRSKIMTALGIGFLNQDTRQNFTVANISITELLKNINKITEQLEDILVKWYKVVLLKNGIPVEYCPKVKVIDSEQLSIDVKKDLVELLYSKLNCSLETAYSLLGIDLEDEKVKRQNENQSKLDDIFAPRQTNYTFTDGGSGGRPTGNSTNPDKTLEDQTRRESE